MPRAGRHLQLPRAPQPGAFPKGQTMFSTVSLTFGAKTFLQQRMALRKAQPFLSIEVFGLPLMETVKTVGNPEKSEETVQKR